MCYTWPLVSLHISVRYLYKRADSRTTKTRRWCECWRSVCCVRVWGVCMSLWVVCIFGSQMSRMLVRNMLTYVRDGCMSTRAPCFRTQARTCVLKTLAHTNNFSSAQCVNNPPKRRTDRASMPRRCRHDYAAVVLLLLLSSSCVCVYVW